MVEQQQGDQAALTGEILLSPERLLHRRSGDILVLVDTKSGEVFELNASAGMLFEQLRAGETLGQAAGAVGAKYQVDPDRVLRDASAFIEALRSQGLLSASYCEP